MPRTRSRLSFVSIPVSVSGEAGKIRFKYHDVPVKLAGFEPRVMERAGPGMEHEVFPVKQSVAIRVFGQRADMLIALRSEIPHRNKVARSDVCAPSDAPRRIAVMKVRLQHLGQTFYEPGDTGPS